MVLPVFTTVCKRGVHPIGERLPDGPDTMANRGIALGRALVRTLEFDNAVGYGVLVPDAAIAKEMARPLVLPHSGKQLLLNPNSFQKYLFFMNNNALNEILHSP